MRRARAFTSKDKKKKLFFPNLQQEKDTGQKEEERWRERNQRDKREERDTDGFQDSKQRRERREEELCKYKRSLFLLPERRHTRLCFLGMGHPSGPRQWLSCSCHPSMFLPSPVFVHHPGSVDVTSGRQSGQSTSGCTSPLSLTLLLLHRHRRYFRYGEYGILKSADATHPSHPKSIP